MRVNEYKELKDFIYEYNQDDQFLQNNLDRQKFMGIEFKYKCILQNVQRAAGRE